MIIHSLMVTTDNSRQQFIYMFIGNRMVGRDWFKFVMALNWRLSIL